MKIEETAVEEEENRRAKPAAGKAVQVAIGNTETNADAKAATEAEAAESRKSPPKPLAAPRTLQKGANSASMRSLTTAGDSSSTGMRSSNDDAHPSPPSPSGQGGFQDDCQGQLQGGYSPPKPSL